MYLFPTSKLMMVVAIFSSMQQLFILLTSIGRKMAGHTGQFPGVLVAQSITGMIGIRETSTHVASIQFYIEAAAQIHSSRTVTVQKAYWLLPLLLGKVLYTIINDIGSTVSKTHKHYVSKY